MYVHQIHLVETTEDMGFGLEFRNSSKQLNKSTVEANVVHCNASRSTKHPDEHMQRSMKGKGAKVDELVKHMSNLPGYLQHPERGEKPQEKVLNVGVLDWSRLEKWKQKHVPGKGSQHSALERTAGASTSSGVVQPATRPEQQASDCSVLKSSQKDVRFQGVSSSAQSSMRFQDSDSVSKGGISSQKKMPFSYRPFGRNHSDIMLDKGKGKLPAQRISSERETTPAKSRNSRVLFGREEDVSNSDFQAKKTRELQKSDMKRKNTDERRISEMIFRSSKSQSSDVLLSSKGKSIACCEKTEKSVVELLNLDTKLPNQAHPVEESDIVHLQPKARPHIGSPELCQLLKPKTLSDEQLAEAIKYSFSSEFSTKEMDFDEHYSEVPHSCPLPSVENRLNRSSFIISKPSDQEDVELSTRKSRNASPNRRFSFNLGRLGRSFSFKENSAEPLSSSTSKSGPVRPETSNCPDTPRGEKGSSHNRGRSSPLRRLLEPILKHKEVNPVHSAEAAKPMKAIFVPRTISVRESSHKEKHEASSVHALLQLTIKNGLPLFKFLVDRSSNCFVATMKNSSEKDDFGHNFTYYRVNEIKKKGGGWMTQGSKGKSCGYAYNVVGQMKVSTSELPDASRQDHIKHIIKEAVLCSVELRQQANQEAPQFMLNKELAAAVVKIPSKDLSPVEHQSDEEATVKCPPEHKWSYNWEDSSVVILPGGIHSSPNKGESSPLISRWKSGGSCDCGGWDVGCKLQVLSNQNRCSQISKTSTASPISDQFELFDKGEPQGNKASFRLMPGKDGTYSTEFSTSISLIQAFFICVVVISSQKPSDMSEAKVPQEPSLYGNSGIQVTGSSKYAPNPPHSPVGRV